MKYQQWESEILLFKKHNFFPCSFMHYGSRDTHKHLKDMWCNSNICSIWITRKQSSYSSSLYEDRSSHIHHSSFFLHQCY